MAKTKFDIDIENQAAQEYGKNIVAMI